MSVSEIKQEVLIRELMLSIEQILRNISSCTEYELINQLQAGPAPLLPTNKGDKLGLFQIHFLLFHTLYRLREQLWQQQSGYLEISVLEIALRDYQPGQDALVETDPLRGYYLDISHLADTSREDVEQLLNSFWDRLSLRGERQDALSTLQLSDPVDNEVIRKQYKKLVMKHHPDRGGDKETLQALNRAIAILIP